MKDMFHGIFKMEKIKPPLLTVLSQNAIKGVEQMHTNEKSYAYCHKYK